MANAFAVGGNANVQLLPVAPENVFCKLRF